MLFCAATGVQRGALAVLTQSPQALVLASHTLHRALPFLPLFLPGSSVFFFLLSNNSKLTFTLLSSLLGTPNEETWPGVSQLPDYKSTFPQWSAQNLTQHIPALDPAGIDFLHVRVPLAFKLSFYLEFEGNTPMSPLIRLPFGLLFISSVCLTVIARSYLASNAAFSEAALSYACVLLRSTSCCKALFSSPLASFCSHQVLLRSCMAYLTFRLASCFRARAAGIWGTNVILCLTEHLDVQYGSADFW